MMELESYNNKPIVLVFSKCDLLYKIFNGQDLDTLDEANFVEVQSGLLNEYSDLIEYLKSETETFNVVFNSSFRKNLTIGIRIGA